MRKKFTSLAAIFVSTFVANTVISCSIPPIAQVWIITDGGDLFDHAFNEQVYNGSVDFAQTFNKNSEQIAAILHDNYWKNHKIAVKYIISPNADLSTLQTNYGISGFAGAKVIIGSGFNHKPALTDELQTKFAKLGIRFVLVDSAVSQPKNVAGLEYSSEQSGFLAAVAAGIWLEANQDTYVVNNQLNVSAFGAVPAESIMHYLIGNYWGYYYLNMTNNQANILSLAQKINPNVKKLIPIVFNKAKDSFTGTFSPGTSEAKTIARNLVDGIGEFPANSVIMAVAGGQTSDLIAAIKNSDHHKNSKIIGVDTDQAQQYIDSKNLFVTSALKRIKESVSWSLWHAFNLQYNKDKTISQDNNPDAFFSGDQSVLPDPLGTEYSGIPDDPDSLVSAIVKDLTDPKSNYVQAASKVTDSINYLKTKIGNNPNWADAWINEINEKKIDNIPKF